MMAPSSSHSARISVSSGSVVGSKFFQSSVMLLGALSPCLRGVNVSADRGKSSEMKMM